MAASETPRYPIGHRYTPIGRDYTCTVMDYWRTYNTAGELVCTRYVADHVFCGKVVREVDVVETTIARAGTPRPGKES